MISDFIIGLCVLCRFRMIGNLIIIVAYTFVSAILSFLSIFRNCIEIVIYEKIHYYSIVYHFLVLSLFILAISKPQIRNFASVSFFYVWLSLLVILVFCNDYLNWMLIAAFSNTGLFILSAFYYYKLFSSTSSIRIFSDSAFWILTGIFICMCLTLPLIAFHAFLDSRNIFDLTTFKNISSIGALAYVFMHFFFIKAFLCYMPKVPT